MRRALFVGVNAWADFSVTTTVLRGRAQDSGSRALNHVGITVANFDETLNYYTKTIGFREAYASKQPDASLLLAYLHFNRDTFLQVQPATANLAPGLCAVEYGDLKAAVADAPAGCHGR